ncbi:hypothetical protein BC938DRAFT_479422 [Jimgerdemannia flammicorona]|nr:hypothetical protein BC938DRAFT_479422 [Jimgerdemannia flammicorona]
MPKDQRTPSPPQTPRSSPTSSPYLKTQEKPSDVQRRHLEQMSQAYRGDYSQGMLLLHAIRRNGKRTLTEQAIAETTNHILRIWEPNTEVDPARADALVKFVKFFVTKTQFPLEEMALEQAIIISCLNRSAVPVVCPVITLALATVYIDRLRKKYPTTQGASGCTQRLFLMSYIMAAKFIHASLGTLIASSTLLHNGHPIVRDRVKMAAAPSCLFTPMQTLASTTSLFASMLPRTTPQELHKMELEFLHFLDSDLTVHNASDLMGLWEKCVGIEQVVPFQRISISSLLADEAERMKVEDDDSGNEGDDEIEEVPSW